MEEGVSVDRLSCETTEEFTIAISRLNEAIKREKNVAYFETTSLVDRYLHALQEQLQAPCEHDFFDHMKELSDDLRQWMLAFTQTPCSRCGSLPTLREVVDMMVLLTVRVVLREKRDA